MALRATSTSNIRTSGRWVLCSPSVSAPVYLAAPTTSAHRVRYLIMAFLVAIAACVAVNWALLVHQARGVWNGSCGHDQSIAVGFTFYASKWPESSWPGCFDYFLHSHQIWHMCVVAAVYIWYRACVASSRLLDERGCVAFVRVNDGTTMLRVRSSFEFKVEPATVDSTSP